MKPAGHADRAPLDRTGADRLPAGRTRADRRRAERRIAAGFGLTLLGAIGFAAAYVVVDDPRWEGLALAVAFAGLAYGFAVWSRDLLPQGPYVEEREPMRSPPPVRAALGSELDRDDAPLSAAALPRRLLVLATGALAVALLFPIRSLYRGRRPKRALATTPWRPGALVVDGEGAPVRPSDVVRGGMLTVFPDGHTDSPNTAAVLIRVAPDQLRLTEDRLEWTVGGLVAYSKLCTHAGCPVGIYVETTESLLCPCHQSVFDVLGGAAPVAGPAARPLPQLPLALDAQGRLVARGDFSEPAGPGYWRKT